MLELLTWALAGFGFAMLGAIIYRLVFAKAVTLEVNFRVPVVGSAAAKVSFKN